jgi:hypothetical protein
MTATARRQGNSQFFLFGSSRSSVGKALIFTAETAETAERCSFLPDDLQSRLSAIFK